MRARLLREMPIYVFVELPPVRSLAEIVILSYPLMGAKMRDLWRIVLRRRHLRRLYVLEISSLRKLRLTAVLCVLICEYNRRFTALCWWRGLAWKTCSKPRHQTQTDRARFDNAVHDEVFQPCGSDATGKRSGWTRNRGDSAGRLAQGQLRCLLRSGSKATKNLLSGWLRHLGDVAQRRTFFGLRTSSQDPTKCVRRQRCCFLP